MSSVTIIDVPRRHGENDGVLHALPLPPLHIVVAAGRRVDAFHDRRRAEALAALIRGQVTK